MCGRTSLAVDPGVITERFDVTLDFEVPRRYNIAPRDDLLAIRNDEPAQGAMLNWGLLPQWIDEPAESHRPINARAETVDEKPYFRDAFEDRHCLVIADGFYEWQGQRGTKQPYRIEREDGEPFAFAGLWETWTCENDRTVDTCTILTTEASELMEPIHDRMPVLLEPDEEGRWLSTGDEAVLEGVLDPYPDDELRAYEISTRVNDPENDDPSVVEPLGNSQSGLDEFTA